jgi:hypothetical protein
LVSEYFDLKENPWRSKKDNQDWEECFFETEPILETTSDESHDDFEHHEEEGEKEPSTVELDGPGSREEHRDTVTQESKLEDSEIPSHMALLDFDVDESGSVKVIINLSQLENPVAEPTADDSRPDVPEYQTPEEIQKPEDIPISKKETGIRNITLKWQGTPRLVSFRTVGQMWYQFGQ